MPSSQRTDHWNGCPSGWGLVSRDFGIARSRSGSLTVLRESLMPGNRLGQDGSCRTVSRRQVKAYAARVGHPDNNGPDSRPPTESLSYAATVGPKKTPSSAFYCSWEIVRPQVHSGLFTPVFEPAVAHRLVSRSQLDRANRWLHSSRADCPRLSPRPHTSGRTWRPGWPVIVGLSEVLERHVVDQVSGARAFVLR